MTDSQGVVTEFRSPKFTNAVSEAAIRRMDCMDCHNRPAHRYKTPNSAVNLAMALGKIDRSYALDQNQCPLCLDAPYTNEIQARESIATILATRYPR